MSTEVRTLHGIEIWRQNMEKYSFHLLGKLEAMAAIRRSGSNSSMVCWKPYHQIDFWDSSVKWKQP